MRLIQPWVSSPGSPQAFIQPCPSTTVSSLLQEWFLTHASHSKTFSIAPWRRRLRALICLFQWVRVVFWWSVSCGKIEVYGLCTCKSLLSWQVQIQVDINSSVVGPSCASARHSRVTWSRNPPGRSRGLQGACGEEARKTRGLSTFLNNPLRLTISFQ